MSYFGTRSSIGSGNTITILWPEFSIYTILLLLLLLLLTRKIRDGPAVTQDK
jgi:hypothetical protein